MVIGRTLFIAVAASSLVVQINGAALVTPSRSSNRLQRRSVLAAVSAPLGLAALPHVAAASVEAKEAALAKARAREAAEAEKAAGRDIDPLTRRLQKSREELEEARPLLETKQWDAVRKITGTLVPVMTFRGYTGESVKSRADAWTEAGEKAKAKAIIDKRSSLVAQLSALDNAVFAAQTNDKKNRKSPEELQQIVTGSIAALDDVIALMGCQLKEDGTERRWRSGACEILPLAPNLRDLAY